MNETEVFPGGEMRVQSIGGATNNNWTTIAWEQAEIIWASLLQRDTPVIFAARQPVAHEGPHGILDSYYSLTATSASQLLVPHSLHTGTRSTASAPNPEMFAANPIATCLPG